MKTKTIVDATDATLETEEQAKIRELEERLAALEGKVDGNREGLDNDFHDLAVNDINDRNRVDALEERLAAAERALQTLSNTLHVIDATSLLSLYSLIKTDNLRQPNFTNNQDIIDSGCSDAINRMMKTVVKVNAAEAERKSKQTKAIKDMMEKQNVSADTSE